MSTLILEDKTVPPVIIKALQSALEQTPPRLLFEYARSHPALMKGLSPRPDSLPILRRRIQNLLATTRHLDPELHQILRESSLQGRLLVVLSETAIKTAFENLAAFFGEANLLAGLLLDERDNLRSLAWNHLKDHPDANAFANRNADQARAALAELFSPFLSAITPLIATSPTPSQPDARIKADLASLRETLQTEQHAKRKTEKERDRFREELEKATTQISRLQEEIESLRQQLQQSRSDAQHAMRELADLRAHLHRRIREGILSEWNAEAARWLRPLHTLETAAQNESRTRSLLEEARTILQEQAERDRGFETRRALSNRLEALESVLREIETARCESLNPHPRLPEVEEKIRSEIEQLRNTLGMPPPSNETEQALLNRINETHDLQELQRLKEWIEGPVSEWRLFPPPIRDRLLNRIADKHHELLARIGLFNRPSSDETPSDDPLRRILSIPSGSVCLFIDGHNFLLTHPLPRQSKPAADAAARDQLAHLLLSASQSSPPLRIRLYFDGPQRSETSRTDTFQIIYSGGGDGPDRADEVILNDLHFFREQYDHCILITDDAELRKKATPLGAHCRAQNLLAALLVSAPSS